MQPGVERNLPAEQRRVEKSRIPWKGSEEK